MGAGGHTVQMLRLVELLGKKFNYEYLVCKGDKISKQKITTKGTVFEIMEPHPKTEGKFKAIFRTIISIFQTFKILRKSKSDTIISCGPSLALPVCLLGKKLFKKRVVYVEDLCRVKSFSLTLRMLLFFNACDKVFYQWPDVHAGRLM